MTVFCVFLDNEREKSHIPLKVLKVGHHWPDSKTPFKWHFSGVPMMAQH